VFVADREGKPGLYVRALEQLDAKPLAGPGVPRIPFVSPDGNWIGFFDSNPNVLRKIAINGGPAVTLCEVGGAPGAAGGGARGASWGSDNRIVFATNDPMTGLLRVSAAGGAPEGSPDGTRLVVRQQRADAKDDLFVLTIAGNRSVERLIETPFLEASATISPDGRWLAYHSNESGQFEVYVRPFPGVDSGRWQVSTGGGLQPVWARDGRELFYLVPQGRAVMAVAIQPGPAFAAGNPRLVFEGQYVRAVRHHL
jgi:WD40 repeat protein